MQIFFSLFRYLNSFPISEFLFVVDGVSVSWCSIDRAKPEGERGYAAGGKGDGRGEGRGCKHKTMGIRKFIKAIL